MVVIGGVEKSELGVFEPNNGRCLERGAFVVIADCHCLGEIPLHRAVDVDSCGGCVRVGCIEVYAEAEDVFARGDCLGVGAAEYVIERRPVFEKTAVARAVSDSESKASVSAEIQSDSAVARGVLVVSSENEV